MIPGFDLRPLFARLARRYTRLAQESSDPAQGRSLAVTVRKLVSVREAIGTRAPGKRAMRHAEPAPRRQEHRDAERAAATERGRAPENARWAAVMSSVDAKDRLPLACSLLAGSEMSAEKIQAMLAASPAERGRAGGGLYSLMAQVPRPDIGCGPGHSAVAGTPLTTAARMRAAYDKATSNPDVDVQRRVTPGDPV